MFGFFRRKLFGPREIEVAASSGSFEYEDALPAIHDPQVEVSGDEFEEVAAQVEEAPREADLGTTQLAPETSVLEPSDPDAQAGAGEAGLLIDDPFAAPGIVQEAATVAPEAAAVEPAAEGQAVENDATDGHQLAFEEVEISEQMRADPFLMGLNPKLRMRPIPRPVSDYTIFETIARKSDNFPPYPEEDDTDWHARRKREVHKGLEAAQRNYADYLQTSRVFISEENQVPGFRRLCLLGPAHFNLPDTSAVVLGVRDDGTPIASRIAPEGSHNSEAPLPSVAAQLEVLLHGREGWKVVPLTAKRDFDLNRHTSAARERLEGPLRSVCADITPVKVRYTAFHILKAKAEQRINLVRWAITRSMDPDVLRMMRGTGLTKMQHGAWLTGSENRGGGPAAAGDDDRAVARQQAVRSYPILARQMHGNQSLREVIDQRQPLAPAIAHEFYVDEAKTKRLQGLTWQMAGATPRDTTPVIKTLLSLNEAHLPTGRTQHRSLNAIGEFGKTLYSTALPEFLAMLGKDGDPYRFLPKIESHSADDIKDALGYLATKLYYPAALRKVRSVAEEKGVYWDHRHVRNFQIVRAATDEMLKDIKPKDLFALSERYHRNIQRFEDRIEKLEDGNQWTPYVGTVDLGEGFTARELSSTEALKTQGRNENHCVGGYATKVMKGDLNDATLIFSIEKAGEIRGTVEIEIDRREACVLDEDGDVTDDTYPVTAAEQVQHRGYGNRDPEADAQAAAKRLIGMINDHDPRMHDRYVAHLQAVREVARQMDQLPSAVREIGFDPWNDEHIADAWEELSVMLPRATRKRGLEAFIESRDISGHRFAFEIGREVENPWDIDHGALLKEASQKAQETLARLEQEDAARAQEAEEDHDVDYLPVENDDELAAAW